MSGPHLAFIFKGEGLIIKAKRFTVLVFPGGSISESVSDSAADIF